MPTRIKPKLLRYDPELDAKCRERYTMPTVWTWSYCKREADGQIRVCYECGDLIALVWLYPGTDLWRIELH
ncbi:MAG: hypothetical protein AAF152_02445 [Cyanobacteria bacterium P01_A01_bin.114]